ncbi:MAG: cation transporter [Acidobacteria bacterium]|nr:MAG: cation transporter [Acidobacteriota bacterium]
MRPSPATRTLYRAAERAALLGLGVNFLLGVLKLGAGLTLSSYALLADAVNSLGDTVTSAAVLAALRVAQRPGDAEHPYGHTRAEAVAGANVALLVILSAAALGWNALRRIGQEPPEVPAWALLLAGANVVVKEALYRYKSALGRRAGSMALLANAWDHRADAFSALAVLVGLAAVRWLGVPWADELAALVVVAAVVWSAGELLWRAASELLDRQADPELVRQVERVALEDPGVRGVETLWLRKSGLEYFADIHVEVDPGLTVAQGHAIAHRVRDRIHERHPRVRYVMVHVEPHEP